MTTRVLVVTPSYPGPDDPDAGIFVHRQVRGLVRHGLSCQVLTYRPAPPRFPVWLLRRTWLRYYLRRLRWRSQLDGIPVHRVFYERRWIPEEDEVPAIGSALIEYVRSRRPRIEVDVVYAQWLWPGGAAALALREGLGLPVVAIARGSEMHDWMMVRPYCRQHVERVLREADGILANCEALKGRAAGLVPGSSQRIRVVYNGCDAVYFRPAENKEQVRRTLRLDHRQKLLLYCGAVVEVKGIRELAHAWAHFSAAHSDWRLLVVGRPVEAALVTLLRSAGAGSVLLTGQVPNGRVRQYMQAADAYVQPSRFEGLANATMEAMAVGLPVITTDTCGQRELIDHDQNGWLVPPHDRIALGHALESMARDPEHARRLGEAARRTILERFDPRKEAARLASLLEEVAQGVSGAHSITGESGWRLASS